MSLKKRSLFFVLGLLCLVSAGCTNLQNYRPIEDVSNLEGRRIGVGCGYAPDYMFTNREDMTLMRYDTYVDMLTALCYRRVDAVAAERPSALFFLNSVSGLRIVEPLIQESGFVAYMANGREQLLQDFNAFAAEFQSTEEFADIVKRLNSPGVYKEKAMPENGTGETITVAVTEDNYPFAYLDFETGELRGSDIEYLMHFANASGYHLELCGMEYSAMELSVIYGRYDMGFSQISEVWRGDVERNGSAMVSDAYMYTDIVLVEVEDFEELEILHVIEE